LRHLPCSPTLDIVGDVDWLREPRLLHAFAFSSLVQGQDTYRINRIAKSGISKFHVADEQLPRQFAVHTLFRFSKAEAIRICRAPLICCHSNSAPGFSPAANIIWETPDLDCLEAGSHVKGWFEQCRFVEINPLQAGMDLLESSSYETDFNDSIYPWTVFWCPAFCVC
jgi:hypothetical protein